VIPIAAVGAFVFGGASSVNLEAAGLLASGSLLGIRAGTRTMNQLSDERLARAFGGFLILIALAMLLL
jgi:uncharacterized membrane protein YfcA